MRMIRNDDALMYQLVDASGGKDAIRLQGFANCSAHQCTVIALPTGEEGETTRAHWDAFQLITTDDAQANAQYALAMMEQASISCCSVHAAGLPLQGIFSSDGVYRDLTIVDNVINSASAHKISIRGMLSGSIIGNVDAAGEPVRVWLGNPRIGGLAGRVGDDVHVLDTVQVQVMAFDNPDYMIEDAQAIAPNQCVEDERGLVVNDRDVFMDCFDREGFRQASRLVDVSHYPKQYRTAGLCRELKLLAVSGEFGRIVSGGLYAN